MPKRLAFNGDEGDYRGGPGRSKEEFPRAGDPRVFARARARARLAREPSQRLMTCAIGRL